MRKTRVQMKRIQKCKAGFGRFARLIGTNTSRRRKRAASRARVALEPAFIYGVSTTGLADHALRKTRAIIAGALGGK